MHRWFLPGLAWLLPAAHAADADPFDPSGAIAHGTGTLQAESPFLAEPGIAAGLSATAEVRRLGPRDLDATDMADVVLPMPGHAVAYPAFGGAGRRGTFGALRVNGASSPRESFVERLRFNGASSPREAFI